MPSGGEPVPLEGKVAALACPDLHEGQAGPVATIETHMSWVFLTERHAYKLKKPLRIDSRDLAALEARRWHCAEEVRLNRRLAPDVYLGMRRLTRDAADGHLALDGRGPAIDYLVWMRRLPAGRMLDHLIAAGGPETGHLDALAQCLARFHRGLAREPLSMTGYRRRLLHTIRATRNELAAADTGLDAARVIRLARRQYAFVLEHAALLDARVYEGRIVEGHGDLRPEHVCFERMPIIIDCLEFDRELRVLDGLDEIAFLALECERLGAAQAGRGLLERYAAAMRDAAPPALVGFYTSYRAAIRALLAIRHNTLGPRHDPVRWHHRAVRYLDLAERHIARAGAGGRPG
ncbi:MAG TPA: hypothetical protein VFA86_00260 [Gammaproteobacteria bacterium]|nr:hypothetical protein [Gammaproteobacteria bacterium]